jgi:hypothetical protein
MPKRSLEEKHPASLELDSQFRHLKTLQVKLAKYRFLMKNHQRYKGKKKLWMR